MKPARCLVVGLAMLGLGSQAQAQSRNCMTHAEASAMIGYAMPDLLAGLRSKCKASLPTGAFLTARSGELEGRYRAQANALWPQARVAFIKMVAGDEMMTRLSDAALRPFLSETFAVAITEDIKPGDCPTVNGVVEMLAPLPPQNLSSLIGIILAAEDKDGDPAGKSGFEICE
jgi:hypothetical protein